MACAGLVGSALTEIQTRIGDSARLHRAWEDLTVAAKALEGIINDHHARRFPRTSALVWCDRNAELTAFPGSSSKFVGQYLRDTLASQDDDEEE
jgi:hypothetical protein